jgi:hypothetical protein
MTIEQIIIRAALFMAGIAVGHCVGWCMAKRRFRHRFPRRRRWSTAIVKADALVKFVTEQDGEVQEPVRIGESDCWMVDYTLKESGERLRR